MKEERGCKAYAELMEVISLSFKNVYKSLWYERRKRM
jgi:hypothetical protein